MPTARQKILNYLSEQQAATVEEISKAFKVTPANIRHHLSILVSQGSVSIIGIKPAAFRGRPKQIYSCTIQRNQNNLALLSEVLLSNMLQNADAAETHHLFRKFANQMAANYLSETDNPTRRLYSSIRALNRMHYQAHWEAHIENPRIMFGQCPYRDILDHHPEICQLDTLLLEVLLERSITQVEKQAINPKGLPQCVFLLNKPSVV